MICFYLFQKFLNVQKTPEESTSKEGNIDRRLIERPHAQSAAEKSQKH